MNFLKKGCTAQTKHICQGACAFGPQVDVRVAQSLNDCLHISLQNAKAIDSYRPVPLRYLHPLFIIIWGEGQPVWLSSESVQYVCLPWFHAFRAIHSLPLSEVDSPAQSKPIALKRISQAIILKRDCSS